jgi:hypothetical protein
VCMCVWEGADQERVQGGGVKALQQQ